VLEAQLSVDDDMRKRWEEAKDENERTEALLATSKSAVEDLSRIIDDAMDDLAGLAEEYASLSLSGSFSAPLEKAILLLEQRCKGMEEKGVGLELLTKVRASLESMKGRLDVLRQAKEKVRERVRRIEGRALGKVRKVEEKMQGSVRKVEERVQDSVRKGEVKVNKTIRTIEGGLQEEVLIFWGTIKEKVLAGFRK